MKHLFFMICLLVSTSSFAKQLNSIVIADNIRQGTTVDISGINATAMNMLLNKGNFGDESCRLRFISYGPGSQVRSIWFATIFNTQTPAGWTTYDASNASGQYKLASYVDTSKLESNSRIGLDLVCWQ